MTDEMLAWQTERLQQLEVSRDGHTVYVRPELVVEVAFNDLQSSSQYPGGLALRFARIKGYRPDKSAADADTLATLQGIWRRQSGVLVPFTQPLYRSSAAKDDFVVRKFHERILVPWQMLLSISTRLSDWHPSRPACIGITCMRPRAPTELCASGISVVFSVTTTAAISEAATCWRFASSATA